MKLIQTFEKPINGYWDGGQKQTFIWTIDLQWPDVTRVGSWGANHYFPVKTMATEKQTLGNARRHLTALATKAGLRCTYTYKED